MQCPLFPLPGFFTALSAVVRVRLWRGLACARRGDSSLDEGKEKRKLIETIDWRSGFTPRFLPCNNRLHFWYWFDMRIQRPAAFS